MPIDLAAGRRLVVWALFLSTSLSLAGCIEFYMRPVESPEPIAPRPGLSTLVFVRPVLTGIREGQIITVVDGAGHFVGQLNDGDHFVAVVPPGHRQLIGFFRDKTDLVDAYLEPGRVYYVEANAVPDH